VSLPPFLKPLGCSTLGSASQFNIREQSRFIKFTEAFPFSKAAYAAQFELCLLASWGDHHGFFIIFSTKMTTPIFSSKLFLGYPKLKTNLMSVNFNYAPGSSWRLYQTGRAPKPQMILTPSQNVTVGAPGPCTKVMNIANPHAAWAAQFAGQPARLNVDGQAVIDNTCLTACSANAANLMVNPSPYAQGRSFYMPGGVPTAVKVFTPCGMAPSCAAAKNAQRARQACGLRPNHYVR